MDCQVKATCTGETSYAVCTKYESTVNGDSKLKNIECKSIEETTEDIYEQLENTSTDLLGDVCIDYVLTTDNKLIIKNVVKSFEDEICTLKQKVQDLENRQFCDIPISSCNINLDCLSLPCEQDIVTVEDLFNALIQKVCTP